MPVAAFTSLQLSNTKKKKGLFRRSSDTLIKELDKMRIVLGAYKCCPEMATGIACAWIRVGAWKPILSNREKLKRHTMISKQKKTDVIHKGWLAFSKQRKIRCAYLSESLLASSLGCYKTCSAESEVSYYGTP